jgi:hypothetical protein
VALELMSKHNMPVDKAFETARVAVYGGSAGGPGGAPGAQGGSEICRASAAFVAAGVLSGGESLEVVAAGALS